MPHPLCSPPHRLPPSPRGGAGTGVCSPPHRLPPSPRCALRCVQRAATLQRATERCWRHCALGALVVQREHRCTTTVVVQRESKAPAALVGSTSCAAASFCLLTHASRSAVIPFLSVSPP
jgi:hypothetical protein